MQPVVAVVSERLRDQLLSGELEATVEDPGDSVDKPEQNDMRRTYRPIPLIRQPESDKPGRAADDRS